MKKFISLMALFVMCLIAGLVFGLPYNAAEKIGTHCRVTAGEDIQQGWLVAVYTNGLAYGADDSASYKVVGVAMQSVASGWTVDVKGGIFRYDNEGGFTDASIGSYAYMWTNTTHYSVGTADTAANDIKAGAVVDVDSYGVWIDTRRQ